MNHSSLRAGRRLAAINLLGAALLMAACGDDAVTSAAPQAPRGILVLDGFIQPGLTFLGDTGTSTTKLAFGPPTEFDAGGFTLLRDTVLAVSSRGAGDLLYVTDVRTSTVRRIQLPSRSNPSRARLLVGSAGQTLIGAALRDSSAIALVSYTGSGAATSTRIANAGTCPTDFFQFDNATWIVDANANCRVNYALLGEVRLIRVPNTGTTRDTILLPGLRGSGASAILDGDVAYISAGGEANFGTTPFTLLASGGVTKVDLRARRVLSTRSMPANSFGASLKLGLDGFLYATISQDLATFRSRIVKVRTSDLTVVPGASSTWMTLLTAAGVEVACSNGQADALGRLHCIQNGAASATSLIVFSPSGTEVRRVAAGQGGVDLSLRP